MAPRSQLEIQTSAVNRLVKEEASYYKELTEKIDNVKTPEELAAEHGDNLEFMQEQEKRALQETHKVLSVLRKQIQNAESQLDDLVTEEGKKGSASNVEHITAAKEAISRAKSAAREIPSEIQIS